MTVVASKLSQVYPHLVEHLSDAEREYLAALLVLRRADEGDELITYGEVADSLFMVAEGDVIVSLPSEGGLVDLGRRGAGRWVGEIGMIEPGPASATVRAGSDATLWILTNEAFQRMRKENPCCGAAIMEQVSKDIATRLRTCNKVLFRAGEGGQIEMVPSQEAPEGVVSKLIHQIKDLFDLGHATPSGGAVPTKPTKAGMSLKTFLGQHDSFGVMSEEDQDHMIQSCEVREFPDGHALIREGDQRDNVYFILDGLVEVQVQKPKDASFAVDRVMGPGEIVGLIALVDRGRRSATCSARGPVKVAVLSLEGANLLVNTRARISCAFQYALAEQLAHDARSLNESLLHAAAHPEG